MGGSRLYRVSVVQLIQPRVAFCTPLFPYDTMILLHYMFLLYWYYFYSMFILYWY